MSLSRDLHFSTGNKHLPVGVQCLCICTALPVWHQRANCMQIWPPTSGCIVSKLATHQVAEQSDSASASLSKQT